MKIPEKCEKNLIKKLFVVIIVCTKYSFNSEEHPINMM